MESKKTLFISHTDLDGFGAYLVVNYFKIPYDTFVHSNYGDFEAEDKKRLLETHDEIFITDFSLPTKQVEELLEKGKKVTIIDHHDYTNTEETRGLLQLQHKNFHILHDTTKSGTKLTFEHFKDKCRQKKALIQFIELVDVYDLWKLENPLREESEDMNRAFYGSQAWNEENKFTYINEDWLERIKNSDEWFFSKEDKDKITRAKKVEQAELTKSDAISKKYIDEKGIPYLITVAPKKISFIASKLLNKHTDVQYVAIVNTYTGIWEKISLRSRESFDVTLIAKGHKQAGAMEVDPKYAFELYKGTKVFQYKEV